MLDDIMKTLDRIPVWKRLQAVPDEVDDITRRVAALEEMLGGKYPPDVCKFCGERSTRLTASLGPMDKGKMQENWTCKECGQVEVRVV